MTINIAHRKKTVENYEIKNLSDDSFLYIEHHKDVGVAKEEYDVEYSIYIGATTEAWRLIVRKNGKYPDDLNGMGWANLLRELRAYMSIPTTGTPEYKNLLTESLSIAEDFKLYENLWD